ncbi:LysR substrate-binding domain-containing protein [Dickeya dadantii]|uniref:LysR substrate-binding domain-containing protein n=1 Tax=Dickeya dadantii TaxID=204038 RepID=UPI001495836F|nr:LysR substrate-binding domain-containing protein [Dickeya dadantii]NPE51905.1 LysR family transcriptional regulator [Dickeya dadantii]
MDNATYGQLAVFHTIAREQSISAAARKLGVTVPSVSKSLRLLESKTGVPLFSRTTRKISLTEAGRALLAKTANAMSELDGALEEILDSGGTPSGLVRLTLSRFAYQLIVRPRLAEFYRTYPHIQLELSINDGTVNLIEQGFDLGIRFGNTLSEGMVAREIYPPFRLGLYASTDYLAKYGTPKSPEELSKHRLITYRFTTSNRLSPIILNRDGLSVAVETPYSMICNDIDAVCDAVSDGIGIGRIFEPLHQRMEQRHNLIPILKKYWSLFPAVYLYYCQNSQRAKRVQAVISFLAKNKNNQGHCHPGTARQP